MGADAAIHLCVHQVLVTQSRYDEPIEAEKKLMALENAGVDNWSGYSYAQEMMRDEGDDD